jgi:hypothetical protein
MPLCPGCHVNNDGATSVELDGAVPADGDATVCVYCGTLAIFTRGAKHLRRPTAAERTELLADPDVRTAMRAVRDFNRQRLAPYN